MVGHTMKAFLCGYLICVRGSLRATLEDFGDMLIRDIQLWGSGRYATYITKKLTVKCHNFSFINVSMDRKVVEIEIRAFLLGERVIVGVPWCVFGDNQPFALVDFIICWVSGGKIGNDTPKA
jgi:hypothetical protein